MSCAVGVCDKRHVEVLSGITAKVSCVQDQAGGAALGENGINRGGWRRRQVKIKKSEVDPAGPAAAATGLTTSATHPPFMASVQPWAITVLWLLATEWTFTRLNQCSPSWEAAKMFDFYKSQEMLRFLKNTTKWYNGRHSLGG